MYELILAGGGSGQEKYMLPVVKDEVENADFVIAPERFFRFLKVKNPVILKNVYSQTEQLPDFLEKGTTAVVVSGDPLMYSMYRTIRKRFPDIKMRILPGISSLQLLGVSFGITMENSAVLSIHGRECTAGRIAFTVSGHESTFFLCSQERGPHEIAEALIRYNIRDTEIYIGSSLTYPEEKFYHGTPEQILLMENPPLCVTAVCNRNPERFVFPSLMPDSAFRRNESPMTKEEVRAVILGKLRLLPDSVVWDIGAGTGSISVECARMCPFGSVYAVEYKPKALEIIEQNREYFQLKNLNIISGRAEQITDNLPIPDCIFIGGSGHSFVQILDKILMIPKKIRLVVSAVTMETQSEAYMHMKSLPDFQIIQLNIGYGSRTGSYRIIKGNNPVTLYCCETKE